MLTPRQILALGLAPGMTSRSLRTLLDLDIPLREILTLPDELLVRHGLSGSAVRSIRDMSPYLAEADHQFELASAFGASIVQFPDEDYPQRLREIWSSPVTLFVWGDLRASDDTNVAIVGTRGATTYGRISTEKYAETFAAAGVTVTSGLARGVDTFAHKAAMNSGGRTFAVIASGLDRIQPSISHALAEKISRQGAVITEYPFGVRAMPAYFPQRNRIISGLSLGTVVVESDTKGGALITARFALDQNRDVFALPGPIGSPKSNGTNNLIRTDRARLTQTPDDVLEALDLRAALPAEARAEFRAQDLSLFEQKVYDNLTGEPMHVDDLSERSGLAAGELLVTLLGLEFKGLVRQMAGKMFLRA